jgi:hypothetical protein
VDEPAPTAISPTCNVAISQVTLLALTARTAWKQARQSPASSDMTARTRRHGLSPHTLVFTRAEWMQSDDGIAVETMAGKEIDMTALVDVGIQNTAVEPETKTPSTQLSDAASDNTLKTLMKAAQQAMDLTLSGNSREFLEQSQQPDGE